MISELTRPEEDALIERDGGGNGTTESEGLTADSDETAAPFIVMWLDQAVDWFTAIADGGLCPGINHERRREPGMTGLLDANNAR